MKTILFNNPVKKVKLISFSQLYQSQKGTFSEWRGETDKGEYVVVRYDLGIISVGISPRELLAENELDRAVIFDEVYLPFDVIETLKLLKWEAPKDLFIP
jgi:hypothetical protein